MTETAPISSHNGPPVESPLSGTTGAAAGGREPARVLLLAHSLQSGGTEAQIVALAKGLDRRRFRPSVLTFYDGGRFADDLRAAGIDLHSGDKRGRGDVAGFAWRLGRLARRLDPDIIYSFLDFPNVVAAALRPFATGARLVWGVRSSDMDRQAPDLAWRACLWFERKLSGAADVIVCNAEAGRRHVIANGFPAAKTMVIPNGIDIARFTPDAAAGRRVRDALGLDTADLLIGLVGRLVPVKDHPTFLAAAAAFAAGQPRARFICVGDGPAGYADELRARARELGIGDRVTWAGHRDDMPDVMNALDINTLSSAYGEGCPNAVCEAMACGVPCAVTDVGDGGLVVGPTGAVVPPGDPRALAAAWAALAALEPAERQRRARACRERIVDRYAPDLMIERTERCLDGLMAGPGRRR